MAFRRPKHHGIILQVALLGNPATAAAPGGTGRPAMHQHALEDLWGYYYTCTGRVKYLWENPESSVPKRVPKSHGSDCTNRELVPRHCT